LPEHTLQIENHFRNLTNCRPVIFGYDAYIEIPKTTLYEASLLRHHYAGLMSMNSCGVNSQAVKDTIIEHAPSCLPDKDIEILKDKIEPLPRGWDNVEGPRKKPQLEPKIIVWNHRANSYKSYPWFLQQMDKLWEQRKDFTVWVPLADSMDREYIYNSKFDRQGYFTELSKCWVGVCGQSHHTGWANSASDGMAVGVPYIFYNADYYSQYAGKAGIYFDKDNEFITKVNMMLDNVSLRGEYSIRSVKLAKENSWKNIIKQYNSHFLEAELKLKMVKKDTDGYKKILDYIHRVGSVTKWQLMDYLGWGRGIPFDIYRNRLRIEPTIKLTKYGYEVR
jgi:glycosyltransferase involved in cell wall biosynthesis